MFVLYITKTTDEVTGVLQVGITDGSHGARKRFTKHVVKRWGALPVPEAIGLIGTPGLCNFGRQMKKTFTSC